MALYKPATMAVLRYRFRGARIATPWNGVDTSVPGHRRMAFDELEPLGRVQESLSY